MRLRGRPPGAGTRAPVSARRPAGSGVAALGGADIGSGTQYLSTRLVVRGATIARR